MKDTLDWHIGKSASGRERLDTASLRACFFWKYDGILVNGAEFTLAELNQFIAELDPRAPFHDEYMQAREDLEKKVRVKPDRKPSRASIRGNNAARR